MNTKVHKQVLWRLDNTYDGDKFTVNGVRKSLRAGVQADNLVVWFETGNDSASLVVVYTGQEVPPEYIYVETIQRKDGIVLHLYCKIT